MNTVSIQTLKTGIINYVDFLVKANQGNGIYETMANDVWQNEIQPFVKNETITTWEADIQKKFINNPYVRFSISEKQAYCLARAFAAINPNNITA